MSVEYSRKFGRVLKRLMLAQGVDIPKFNLAIGDSEVLYPIPVVYRTSFKSSIYNPELKTQEGLQHIGSGGIDIGLFPLSGYEGEATYGI